MSKNLIPSYPLRVSPELKAEMTTQATAEGINLNKAIAKAMRFYLDSKKNKLPALTRQKLKQTNKDLNHV